MLMSLKPLRNMAQKVVLDVEGKKLHLVLGKGYSEWLASENVDGDLWDFLMEELLDGSIEINEDIWYWLIGDRCYETYEEVEE